ncbi:hypothetical protein, partial [Enterococcus faecalis]|uniref:hypothetical protein n=1 Tax=Enterococcus faecalis TaxID=1351 RepID=UPI003D6A32DB
LLTIKGAIPVLMRPAAQFTLRSVFGENVIFSLTQRHYRADGELSTTLDPRQCAVCEGAGITQSPNRENGSGEWFRDT